MGHQYIFVVETNKKVKSDWIYIKETIDFYFSYDEAHTKFSPVYMNGKGNYLKTEKDVLKLIKQYASTSANNSSTVLYCFDCDNYDTDIQDKNFISEVKAFCEKNKYEYIWFCKDIEHVYLKRQITDNQKKDQSADFKRKNFIKSTDAKALKSTKYRNKTSNILIVLNKFFEPKTEDDNA